MRRDTQGLLLFLVGGALLKIALAGTAVRYVRPGAVPLLVIAGLALVGLAGVTLYRDLFAPSPVAVGEDAPAPVRLSGEPRIGWLLLIPVLVLLLVPPPALGSYQAVRLGVVPSGPVPGPLAAGDPVALSLQDYAGRAAADHGRSLDGRSVALTGFVIPGANGELYLARLALDCCVADARPVKVGLTGPVPLSLSPDQWVEVVGSYVERTDRDPVNDVPIPYLQVDSVTEIPPPAHPYEP